MPIYAKEMMFGTMEEFLYFECKECGCLQIKKIPTNIDSYYPRGYYSYNPFRRKGIIISELIKLRNKYAIFGKGFGGKVLQHFHTNYKLLSLSPLSLSRNARILDVGCGVGEVLLSLREMGFTNLLGVDPFLADDLIYENGLRIMKRSLDEIKGEWDLIMFHHSFEHLPNPLATLEFVRSVLSDNGWCVIRIPTVSSFAWGKYRENWVELDAPRHLFLHSVKSMKMLAMQANLQLIDIIYDSTAFQFWGSEQYLRGIPLDSKNSYAINPKNSIFSKKEIRSFEREAKNLNKQEKGDRAVFYFKKHK